MSILLSGYSRECVTKMHNNQDKFGGIRVLNSNHQEITAGILSDGVSLGYDGAYASYNTIFQFLDWATTFFPKSYSFDVQNIAREIQNQMIRSNHILNDYSDLHANQYTCCTICGIVTDEKQILVFNAGDSRLYELTESGQVRCMTRDDRAEDGYSIAMHIGGKNDEEIRLTFSVDEYHPNSKYVLCTDGFYKRTNFSEFHTALSGCHDRSAFIHVIQKQVDQLISCGEKDDITALILSRNG